MIMFMGCANDYVYGLRYQELFLFLKDYHTYHMLPLIIKTWFQQNNLINKSSEPRNRINFLSIKKKSLVNIQQDLIK